MSVTKDQFIDRYGGFRFGETEQQTQARIARIDALYDLIKQGKATPDDIDELSELRGAFVDD